MFAVYEYEYILNDWPNASNAAGSRKLYLTSAATIRKFEDLF